MLCYVYLTCSFKHIYQIVGGLYIWWKDSCLVCEVFRAASETGTVLGRNGFSCFYPSPPNENEGAGANGFYCEFVTSMWFWSKWRVPSPLQHNHIPIVVFGLSGPWSNRPKGLITPFLGQVCWYRGLLAILQSYANDHLEYQFKSPNLILKPEI